MKSKSKISQRPESATYSSSHLLHSLSLGLSLSLSFGTFALKAEALPARSPISLPESQQVNSTLKQLLTLDQSKVSRIFEVKNHKGESIFRKQDLRRRSDMEAGQWATLDPTADSVEGTSTEKVYQNFKIPQSKNEVIVAVIDSGVDIQHEDLKGHVWVNFAELFGKPGVDDDNDGYVDDIYGWNFLGNKNGKNVEFTNLEVTRIYAKLKKLSDAGAVMTAEEQALYLEVSKEVKTKLSEAQANLFRYQAFDAAIKLLKANGLEDETVDGLDDVTSDDADVIKAKELIRYVYAKMKTSEDIKEGLDYFTAEVNFHYNLDFSSSDIVKDDPNNLNEIGYGNGDVTGPDAHHGTHVAGIIAANRLNNLGINGQALNVKIMSIRAVPNGDERDKDVGQAIHFAVDHGARIINMSFGKSYSPQKSFVDEAMKYAEASGVLLVHAAGNDGKSTETLANNFPNRKVHDLNGNSRNIESWIEVGASSKTLGLDLPADFSNYGKTSVDVFAPGKDIVSTIPGNKYASISGTSMASPETAGVAALLLEKYPFASALEIKAAILKSTRQYGNLQCTLPGSVDAGAASLVKFSDLSATGGVVDAYQAMLELGKI